MFVYLCCSSLFSLISAEAEAAAPFSYFCYNPAQSSRKRALVFVPERSHQTAPSDIYIYGSPATARVLSSFATGMERGCGRRMQTSQVQWMNVLLP
ncbi:hypothetical protein BX070DRAFT_225113 [Coemansia spiralis]|nr:hypothetical protein BX070DRAFT_225113 [Coemansia spiralis]